MVYRVLAWLSAVVAVVAVFLPGGPARPDFPDVELVLVAVGVVLAALCCQFGGAGVRVFGALLALGCLGYAVLMLLADLLTGTPGSSSAVLLVAALAAAVAAVVASAAAFRSGRRLAARTGVVLATVAVLVLGATASAAGYLVPESAVRSQTAAAVAVPPVAEQPGARRWTWSTENGLRDVATAGAGVAVSTWNGEVFGVDGATGKTRWRYARQGASVSGLASTPDGRYVVAGITPGGVDTGASLLVVLDALTGAVTHQEQIAAADTGDDSLAPTSSVLPITRRVGDDDQRIVATRLRDGERAWSWRAPRGCTSPFALPASGRHVVLAPVVCARSTGVLALRETDGGVAWRQMFPYRAAPDGSRLSIFLDATADGRVVRYHAGVGEPGADALRRASDGTLLTGMGDYDYFTFGSTSVVLERKEREPQVTVPAEVIGSDRARRVGDWAPCAGQYTVDGTTSLVLRLCSEGGAATLQWRGISGGEQQQARVELPNSPARLPDLENAAILAAPGAIVVASARYERENGPVLTGFATGG